MLAERQLGMLPSTIESNLREHVKAITLRSGKELTSSLPMVDDDIVIQDEPAREEPEAKVIELAQTEDKKKCPLREYQLPIPYPARLKQEKVNQQFSKFLGLFKQLSINLPFVEAILQMPSDALADLGASIDLIPSSLFEKLGLSEPKPTRMSVQLVDRTMKFPRGIVEDVLVKVDKFIFSVDFVVMDMEGESSVPLILSRPFLATSRAVIDVALQAEDEEELSNEDVLEQLAYLLTSEPSRPADHFIDIDRSRVQKLRPSLEEPPALELKELPKHLTYAYLDEVEKLSVIIATDLTLEKREMTLASLRNYP
ncbi:uncharacterized protein LOC125370633 [Ricinus communis]|uniref:uncharacterized protein LOC125370633 n=1 Tax=Ricinus communis TaxID=3988 RepID=UPI00201AC7F0|nr:uncharacterized protein LOC125370633 [Ricinus communis]